MGPYWHPFSPTINYSTQNFWTWNKVYRNMHYLSILPSTCTYFKILRISVETVLHWCIKPNTSTTNSLLLKTTCCMSPLTLWTYITTVKTISSWPGLPAERQGWKLGVQYPPHNPWGLLFKLQAPGQQAPPSSCVFRSHTHTPHTPI